MRKWILFAVSFLAFSGWVDAEKSNQKQEEMERLVNNISGLAAKVLEIFEPIAAKASNQSFGDGAHTYFVSFLLRDRKNKTTTSTPTQPDFSDTPKQRMVVNNNFNGEKMGMKQVFNEAGQPIKQPPSHNLQLVNKQAQPQSPNPYPQQAQQPQLPTRNYG